MALQLAGRGLEAQVEQLLLGLGQGVPQGLVLQATLYNAFANERYQYDPSNDLEPRLEITPMTFQAFRFFLSAAYTF